MSDRDQRLHSDCSQELSETLKMIDFILTLVVAGYITAVAYALASVFKR